MMARDQKMICPQCREEMNHHADKLVYSDVADESSNAEYMEEFYTCSHCGDGASRPA
jgi:uncharacterized protein with PIN domain